MKVSHLLRSALPTCKGFPLLKRPSSGSIVPLSKRQQAVLSCSTVKDESAATDQVGGSYELQKPSDDLVDILKIDLRVGKILSVKEHPEAEDLLVEEIDVGETEPRVIVSGLKKYVEADKLQSTETSHFRFHLDWSQGSPVIVVCNLKPRKLRGVQSHGMLLCASNADHSDVEPLTPSSSTPGERLFYGDGIRQEPASANQVQKKKIWESCMPHLRTDGQGRAHYKEYPMMTSEGPVVSTLFEASLS